MGEYSTTYHKGDKWYKKYPTKIKNTTEPKLVGDKGTTLKYSFHFIPSIVYKVDSISFTMLTHDHLVMNQLNDLNPKSEDEQMDVWDKITITGQVYGAIGPFHNPAQRFAPYTIWDNYQQYTKKIPISTNEIV